MVWLFSLAGILLLCFLLFCFLIAPSRRGNRTRDFFSDKRYYAHRGLHDDNQYSTVEEIGLILCSALKNKTFHKVFTTQTYTVGASEVHPDGFTFSSSMFKNMESPTVIGGEIKGGKTGYTDEAGHCLASMAEIQGREYILVTAGWAADPRTTQYHINDAFIGYNALGRALGG